MKKKHVIEYFGSPSKVARALEIHPAAVSQWGDDVPLLRAYQIERITDGQLKVEVISPDAAETETG